MVFKEETIKSEDIYRGKILNLRIDTVKLPNGNQSKREIVEHPGGVVIIAVTNDCDILLVEQFRKPTGNTLLELPAGKLEPGEEPVKCAARELIEETGFQAGRMDFLFSFYTTPGFCDEILHLFIARDLKEVGAAPDEDEFLKIHKLADSEILDSILSGKIQDGKSIIGLLAYVQGERNV